MKYNIWMLFIALQKFYNCNIYAKSAITQDLTNIRLYNMDESKDDNTMYVEKGKVLFSNQDERVYCEHKGNYFIVESENVNEVFNRIIHFMEENQTWINHVNIKIANNCLLSEVLSEFREKLPFPVMVLDVSQTALAISENFQKGSIDENWDRMIETGTFAIEPVSTYNEMYKDSIYRKDFYYIPANPFPYPSYNRNIYINDEFMGFLSLILIDQSFTEEHRGWYYIAWESISNWFSLHMGQNDLLLQKSVFEEIMNGETKNIDYFNNILSTFGWKENCNKQIIVLGCISNHLNMNTHIAKLLNHRHSYLYANEYQDRLVILCNIDEKPYEEQLASIHPIIFNSGYYGGSSNIFTNLADAPHYLLQAMLPFWSEEISVGEVSSCQNHILPYSFHLLKTHSKMSLTHPAVLQLQEYDEAHSTDYAYVLYEYLCNRCNQTETAQKLNMHRSSLLRKIAFIEQMTNLDFNDYKTRLHLLISYELQMAF